MPSSNATVTPGKRLAVVLDGVRGGAVALSGGLIEAEVARIRLVGVDAGGGQHADPALVPASGGSTGVKFEMEFI